VGTFKSAIQQVHPDLRQKLGSNFKENKKTNKKEQHMKGEKRNHTNRQTYYQ
jgi:Sec-independent protein translocase protein TatA